MATRRAHPAPRSTRHREHRRPDSASTRLPAPSLLQLIWLASPALPVGGFSYSEVLEAAVEAGLAATESDARAWLLDQLHLGLARGDLALVARAHGAWRRGDLDYIVELNAWVATTRESHELRQQTEQMGRSLVEWMKNRPADARHVDQLNALAALRPAPTWPVAFALAAFQAGAPCRESLLCCAFGWAENLMQAALKSVPLGQAAGQRILSALAAEIPDAVDAAMRLGNAERQVCTPMLAILSAQHETQYSRLFRS
ncbi:MAG: urease accessory UreF family protein [Burkholderiaceae bacterium]|nr:urease accessory UreF family protein [Burkholderiaceae bacterium]